jgi:hypothetical protein
MVKFLDRVLVQMHEIVEDYENMLLTLERGLQSEAKTRKALLEFQKSHDRLIFERARLFAELSHVIKSGNPAPVRAFFRSLLRILDARELALAHRRLRGTRLPSMSLPSLSLRHGLQFRAAL